MDRNSIIGFILIAIVFMVWMYLSAPAPEPQKQADKAAPEQTDTNAAPETDDSGVAAEFKPSSPVTKDSLGRQAEYGKWFSDAAKGTASTFTVETDLYRAVFTTRGGAISRWTLNDFFTWNEKPLQLIDWRIPSDLNLFFGTSDGKLIDTRQMYFEFPDYPEGGKVVLQDSAEYTFRAVLPVVGDSATIVKTYTLRNGRYDFHLDVEMNNMGAIIANNEYQMTLHSLNYTEQNSVDESTFAEATAYVSNERNTLDASDMEELKKENYEGTTDWIATHNKYFLNAIVTSGETTAKGAYLEGVKLPRPDNGEKELYQASMKVVYRGEAKENREFTVYYGPMDYDVLNALHPGLEQVMSLGWAFVVRPFSEYLILPLFSFLHTFIPNYGWVIIIFSIIIKIVLYPLTKKSMKSMKRMQALQPMMTELKEKHKDDQQRQSAEMMKLYKDYGVNPAGGCLPLLLQMPILYALFVVFRSTIELRQEPFMLWIDNLAAPDILFDFGFQIPILGFSYFSGLALLMGATMFIQQKQTITDPRQKMMVYFMPVMFWLLFNSFPSGLNLYYFMFNLLSILQQWWINKSGGEVKLEKVVRKNKGKSWTERMMESAQQKQKAAKKSR